MWIGEKAFRFVALFLVLVFSCFAQGVRKDDIAISSVGGFLTGVPNAQVRVCVDGALGLPCNPTVPIYSNSDLALGHALPNPFTADSQGNYFFYTLPGTYEVQVTTPTGTYTQNDQTYPNLPGAITTTFNYTLVASSSTPIFNFVPNMMYRMVLTSNVASSTLVGAPASGNVAAFSLCQDGIGGRTFPFPSNFVLPSGFTVNPFAGVCTNFIFLYDGTNWQGIGGWNQIFSLTLPMSVSQGGTGVTSPAAHGIAIGEGSSTPFNFAVPTNNAQCFMSAPINFSNIDPSFQTCPGGGGGGGSSVGPQGTFQEAGSLSGSFSASPLVDVGRLGTTITNSADWQASGPNPYMDIRQFGAVAVNTSAAPYLPGITATMSSSSAIVTLSNSSTFVNGMGVDVLGAGPAHAMSTPAAPTVTSSNAAAPAPSGYVVPGAAGGSETICYKIAARDKAQGITAASAETCVTGQTRGYQTVNISNIVRSAGTLVTVTTSTAHTISVGTWLYIHGTTNDPEYAGYFLVTTVPDNTHVTYQWSRSSLAGATTVAANGGTVTWLQGNHLLLPNPPPAGVFQYGIYRGASGAEVFADVSGLVTSGISLDSSYMTWDDFGTTYTTVPNVPVFWPTSPPSSPTNDSLITTIASGTGTTTLTLVGSATNAVASATILSDNSPNIVAAFTAAQTAKAMVYIPTVASGSFGTNSVLDLSSYGGTGVSVVGPLFLGDTMLATSVWHGDLTPASLSTTAFSIQALTPLFINAKPGIAANVISMTGLALTPQGTNCQDIFIAPGSIPTGTFTKMAFLGSPSGADFSCVPAIAFTQGNAGATASGLYFEDILTKGSAQGWAPLIMTKNFGQITFNGVMEAGRGMFFSNCPTCTISSVNFTAKFENQGPAMPLFTTRGSFVFSGGTNEDTGAQPIVAHLGPGPLFLSGVASAPSSGMSAVVGANIQSIVDGGLSDSQQGANTSYVNFANGLIYDGVYNTNQAISVQNAPFMLGPNYSLFTNPGLYPAPTCSVISGGPLFPAAGSYTFSYLPVYPNGGRGLASPFSSGCTVNGTSQQIRVTLPGFLTAVSSYIWILPGGNFPNINGVNCVNSTTTALTWVFDGSLCGFNSLPAFSGGGPAGIQNSKVWGDFFPNAPNNVQNALPSFDVNGKLVATSCIPSTAGSQCVFNGTNWGLFAGSTTQAIHEESAAGVSSWVTAPLGNLVGTGQGNAWTAGVQDFSAVSEFRPKSGTVASIPVACNIPDIYFGTDATPGQNWFFCTVSGNPGTWTQQLNSGFLGLNTYGVPHTLNINETWANFNATTTVTVPHTINTRRWVVFCVSPCSTLTLAPDSGNITLNNLVASTAAITTGLGVEVACDLTNCFAWGLGGSGGGSGTVSSCTVNGIAYYSAVTTTFCVTPPTSPSGVPQAVVSIPSGGVSQPPTTALPGIVGRAVSGTAATDTIGNGTGTGAAPGGSTDCNPNRVEYVGSVAVAVALPTATALGVPKCVFKLVNFTSPPQTVTITPTTWTINGSATLNLTFGQQLWVYVDPNSATNWVADQTDLFGNVSGAAVPVSAKLVGTNSGAQLIAAVLANTHIYVGNGSNLPADVAVSGDVTLANTGAFTVIGANGGTFPASANVLATNGSKQPITATAHNTSVPLQCADTSGSGTAQVCNTSPTFTPVAGDWMIYTTTTDNSGTGLTINWNSLGAKSVAKWQNVTTLAAHDIRANTQVLMTYDGTNIEASVIGNAPSGGGGGTPCTTTALSVQYNNSGAFGCMTEFTYATSTLTLSSIGKIDMSAASVTAALLIPKAAGAAPTNGGIFAYDTTNNRFVGGNAVNTSVFPWFTAAPTTNVLRKASGTLGLQIDSSITDDGTTVTTTDTGGVKSPVFTSTGTVAGFIDLPQGPDPTSTAPCNTANSECRYAGTSQTAMFVKIPTAPPNIASYEQTDSCASAKCVDSFHPVPVLLTVASDFTTAANTSLQTITGLSTTMPASTVAVASFHCSLNWTQATGTAAVAFGIQGATTAPTSINANATSFSNTTAETTGTLNGLATTTATAIVSVAPSAITTIWKAEMDGTIEAPSNASPTVVNWMVSTATAGDAVTVKRGSYCSVVYQ
jgi:hypothetical protein